LKITLQRTFWLLLSFLFFLSPGRSKEDEEPVLTQEEEKLALKVMSYLRCPVCEAQSVKDSSTFLAQEIRREVRRMVKEGKGEREILAYFRQRYGDEILLFPPEDRWERYGVWLFPLLFFLGGFLVLLYYFSQRRKVVRPSSP